MSAVLGPRSAFSIANVIVCDDLILIRHSTLEFCHSHRRCCRIKFGNVADVICEFSHVLSGMAGGPQPVLKV